MAKAAATGLNHGFRGLKARMREFLVGIEKQDSVLGHDADHHDQAHNRSQVDGGPGNEQSQKYAGDRKQR